MVVSDSRAAREGTPGPPAPTPARVVWHDLECGGYRADLTLWHELAQSADGPILDVGAGTGRVSLALAAAGLEVTAVDRDRLLLGALQQRATESGLGVETVCADARSFSLDRHDFAACLMPMQTIQLLGGAAGRLAFLRRAREHLRPGATIACALLSTLEPFDCSQGMVGPAAERAHVDGLLYLSRATRVSELDDCVVIERDRRVLVERPSSGDAASELARSGERRPERDVIELDRLDAGELERDALELGLRALGRREIAPTDEHVGSIVVVLGV